MSEVIDFRVRLPLELRPSEDLPADYLTQYDQVLDLSANRHRTLEQLIGDMDGAGVSHAVVHAEYEYGDEADALNDAVAKVVSEHPGRFSGYGTISMDHMKIPRALAQVQRVHDLGLNGLSLQPSFFGIAIDDRLLYPVYAKACELGLPVALHTGINYTVTFPIRNDQPIQLDQVACDLPDLTLIACHAGWPWVPEMVAVMRKHPNVYADISAVHYRPWRYWQAMVTALEYGVTHKLLLGSDFPSATVIQVIDGLRAVNRPVEGTGLPTIPTEVQEAIIHDNWKRVFPEWA